MDPGLIYQQQTKMLRPRSFETPTSRKGGEKWRIPTPSDRDKTLVHNCVLFDFERDFWWMQERVVDKAVMDGAFDAGAVLVG